MSKALCGIIQVFFIVLYAQYFENIVILSKKATKSNTSGTRLPVAYPKLFLRAASKSS